MTTCAACKAAQCSTALFPRLISPSVPQTTKTTGFKKGPEGRGARSKTPQLISRASFFVQALQAPSNSSFSLPAVKVSNIVFSFLPIRSTLTQLGRGPWVGRGPCCDQRSRVLFLVQAAQAPRNTTFSLPAAKELYIVFSFLPVG